MRSFRLLLAILIVVAVPIICAAQAPPDDETVWRDFMAWFRTAPAGGNPLAGYPGVLGERGTPRAEIERRMAVIGGLLGKRSDWIETHFDRVYSRRATGNPVRDGFASAPSTFLAEVVKNLRPGDALDAGMGQGRNAVYLASLGWRATGFDLSAAAVKAAKGNAAKAGVRIEAVKASYDDFQYGADRWDLIVLVFAWAPVTDPAFVAKLHTALRPGGRIVFEHFIEDAAHPRPAPIRALAPGQLRLLFQRFRLERYDEVDGVGDWGGPGERLVRMAVVK